MNIYLGLALTGPSPENTMRHVANLGIAGPGLPVALNVDGEKPEVTVDWLDRWLPETKGTIMAFWELHRDFVRYSPVLESIVAMKNNYQLELLDLLTVLAQIPFALCSTRSLHDDWGEELTGEEYNEPGFGGDHFGFGWGCAFKAEGHRHLLSKRVIDFGPWRVLRGENDVTLVQFHDIEAPVLDALHQARPGHQFMQSHIVHPVHSFVSENDEATGIYEPEERKLKIVVNSRNVSLREMKDTCSVRFYQLFGPEEPIDDVAYVFVNENEARAHLHDLWLCGMECWTVDGGRERRLDLDYSPPIPAKPDWVKRLEDKTGQ